MSGGERMLVEAIAETLQIMKKEDPMSKLLLAKEAKAMADDHNIYKRVLKAIAKLIHLHASNGNYECVVEINRLEPKINKERLAFLLRDDGYKVVIFGQSMRINWSK